MVLFGLVLLVLIPLAVGLGVGLDSRRHRSKTSTPVPSPTSTAVSPGNFWQPPVGASWQIVLGESESFGCQVF